MIARLVSTTVCALLGATPFAAGAVDGYFGGGLGYAQYDYEEFVENGELQLEDDRMTWQVYAGMKFVPSFGLEANYVDFDEAAESGVALAADGFGLALAGHLPVTDNFTLSARVGQLWWDADVTADAEPADISFSDDGTDIFYGLDARFGQSEGLGFAIRLDRYEVGEADINMPSVNLELGF